MPHPTSTRPYRAQIRHSLWIRCGHGLFLAVALTLAEKGTSAGGETEANVMIELPFTARHVHADPFNQVTLDVVFTQPNGTTLRVPAFWAGAKVWKARYASPITGTHRFRSECSDTSDEGLQGVNGRIEVTPYRGSNPLYARGPLKTSANRRYLEHTDGTPFFWLGDTWWMGLCHRLRWPEDFQKLATDRKQKGFNVIQLVAGLYPDMHPFDARGANEAGFPWETNYTTIRPAYFDAADQRLHYLVEQGFTPCLVGAWGYFIPWMGVEKAKQHWRYLIARYGALPVVWCVAGEANLPWYLANGFPYDDRGQVKDWTVVMRYVRETDPFHRLVTIHPTGIGRLSARNATDDIALLDIDMLQTPHGQREAVPPTVRTIRESYADHPIMPVINGEASYEMLNDTIPAQWPRAMFWICMLNGAAGHTYGANGIWQVNRRGQPHGPSPNGAKDGVGYGRIAWDEAMDLPGSHQVALGKQLLQQYPWHHFTPHPEWAAFASKPKLSLEACQWIWFPEGNPAQNAPTEKRFFRKSFTVPPDQPVAHARLFVTADDVFTVWLNGEKLGAAGDWRAGREFENLARLLQPGVNAIAIEAENKPANVPANPAGLLAHLEITRIDNESMTLVSDTTWLCEKQNVSGWNNSRFDDSAWPKVAGVARYGAGPWGRVSPRLPLDDPQAAGIPDSVRVVWMPRREPVVLHHLGPQTVWSVTSFDPISGARRDLGSAQADAAGQWTCPAPAAAGSDWVLILERKR